MCRDRPAVAARSCSDRELPFRSTRSTAARPCSELMAACAAAPGAPAFAPDSVARGRRVAAAFLASFLSRSAASARSMITAGSPSGTSCAMRSCSWRSAPCASSPTVTGSRTAVAPAARPPPVGPPPVGPPPVGAPAAAPPGARHPPTGRGRRRWNRAVSGDGCVRGGTRPRDAARVRRHRPSTRFFATSKRNEAREHHTRPRERSRRSSPTQPRRTPKLVKHNR